MKYIVYEEGDQELLVTFPKCIDHDKMAEAMERLRFGGRNWHRAQGKIVAAGFIDGGECHGKSETLNIQSRPGTDTLMFRANGIRKLTSKTTGGTN